MIFIATNECLKSELFMKWTATLINWIVWAQTKSKQNYWLNFKFSLWWLKCSNFSWFFLSSTSIWVNKDNLRVKDEKSQTHWKFFRTKQKSRPQVSFREKYSLTLRVAILISCWKYSSNRLMFSDNNWIKRNFCRLLKKFLVESLSFNPFSLVPVLNVNVKISGVTARRHNFHLKSVMLIIVA